MLFMVMSVFSFCLFEFELLLADLTPFPPATPLCVSFLSLLLNTQASIIKYWAKVPVRIYC